MSRRLLIGTDEAGYGPNLGPLTVTATAWEIPEGVEPASLWEEFGKVVTNAPTRGDQRLFVADSKQVYSSGDGLEDLEVAGNETIPIVYSARDDFGVSTVKMNFQTSGREKILTLKSSASRRSIGPETFKWDLAGLALAPGERVSYRIEAGDNDSVSGPKFSSSRTLHLYVRDDRSRAAKEGEEAQQFADALLDLLADQLEELKDPDFFRQRMEEILDVYQETYDEKHPLICMDEASRQVVSDVTLPLPMKPGAAKRVDDKYERQEVRSLLMFYDPIAGWRRVGCRESRTRTDWALEIKQLVDVDYPHAERITLVCDNLNTHTKGAFYETFEPEKARSLIKRLEFCHTPKHGSWLNIAENELSSMTRQCITSRRFETIEKLREETTAWQNHSNVRQRGVDWQFKVDDARVKLKSIYPKLEV